MIETVAIIILADYILNGVEPQETLCKFLVSNLGEFRIEKVTFLKQNESSVTAELFSSSRQFDVVIVLNLSTDSTDVLTRALRNLTREGLNKATTNGNVQENHDVLSIVKILNKSANIKYFHRIFLLEEQHLNESSLEILKNHLRQYRKNPKFSKTFTLANIINNVKHLEQFCNVSIENNAIKATLERSCFDEFVKFEKIIKEKCDGISKICDNSDILEIIYNSNEKHIRKAIEDIEECFETYGPDNVFLSFNGGKDCTVLLHLIYIVLKIKYPEHNTPIFCMYVKSKRAFDEQEEFVSQCQIFYNLEVESLSMGMKEALEEVLTKRPHLKACFIGTRRTDPFSMNLKVFQMTDPSWPKVLRVNPLLDWHYSDIWDYLLFYKVPYCKLYDMGYTSLGNVSNTTKNPGLNYYDAIHGRDDFLPAYKLLNEMEERNGRELLK